ncbi:putative disease resistance RPP13-like protein 1 [Eucalyptus grandis]|uniref:putative disease resistance RPP13-like protein 1 n=1 Tax=Eucalyptus grandis TaxID=71139 RepID=UPI00192EF0B2|nr:putative disease resistance RPP13-like protein 1 [Eucalyptus grandis]
MNLRTFLPLNVDHVTSNEYFFLTDEVLHVLLPTLSWLRVLSLSHYQKLSMLPSSVGCLKHLRYLNLSYNRSLSRLPDSITALYNLQTLILAYCQSLIELPRNMGSLTCLRHLDLRGTFLKRMPLGMSRLKNLQTLTNFVVAENGGTRVRELGELGNLMGTLSIQGLQNVDSYRDAEIVDLQGKRYLKKLLLEWGSDNNIMQQNCLNVLDKLQPHWNLTELIIISYSGKSFSDWLGHGSFSNMSVMRLESCKHCVSLPPLGQLPSLEKLIIKGFDGVTSVGTEFNGSNCIPFQSLKYLEFVDMCSWKEWASFAIETGGLAFAHLQELCIRNCPKLSGGLPSHLPSLTALSIEKCPQLTSSLPFAPLLREIKLDDCGNFSGVEPLLNGIELRDMKIKNFSALPLRFLPPTMTRLNLEDGPEIELPIHRCHECGVRLDGARLTNVPKIHDASTISNTGTCLIEMHLLSKSGLTGFLERFGLGLSLSFRYALPCQSLIGGNLSVQKNTWIKGKIKLGFSLGNLRCDGIGFLLGTTNMLWWMSDAALDGPILPPRYQDSFSKMVVVRK